MTTKNEKKQMEAKGAKSVPKAKLKKVSLLENPV